MYGYMGGIIIFVTCEVYVKDNFTIATMRVRCVVLCNVHDVMTKHA